MYCINNRRMYSNIYEICLTIIKIRMNTINFDILGI